MDEKDEANNITVENGKMKGILKKYNHKRKLKTTSSSEWKGPSHKKFSEYFSKSSESSSNSDSETEELSTSPAKKMNFSKSSDSASDTEDSNKLPKKEGKLSPIKGDDSDSGDSLILPSKTSNENKVLHELVLSESEPEDPDELKAHQKRLEARKSRVNSNLPIIPNVSKPLNRTLNLTAAHNRSKFIPARLSEVSPDLLDLSSSSEEEEEQNSRFNFILKDSDSGEAAVASPKERKRKSKTLNTSKLVLEPEKSMASTSKADKEKSPSPSKLSTAVQDPIDAAVPGSPLNRTVTLKAASPAARKSRSSRISTPQPKKLAATKLTRSSKRVSKSNANSTLAQQPSGSPVLNHGKENGDSPSISKRNLRTPLKSALKEPRTSPGKSSSGSPSKGKDRPKSPSFESEVLSVTFAVDENVAVIGAEKSIERKSRKTPKRKSVKRQEELVKVTEENEHQDSDAGNNSRRTLRSSKPTPPVTPPRSPLRSPARNAPDLASGNNQFTLIRPMQDYAVTRTDTEKHDGPRFMASSRPALRDDPIQYSLLYDSGTLFAIMWKLRPRTVNYSRTRGETCILVLEGEISIEDQAYPRGNVIKLAASSTYSVTNNSDTDALYQVTEYL